uniref:Jacalin-type lectin domain-containing protein n=1 Tax=Phytophthora ramorum TaxID=164328 RepID=H3GBL1_PHYRM
MVLRVVLVALQALAFVAFVAVALAASDDTVQLSETFGGPHGTEFSDQASVVAGETVSFITIRTGERVDGISLGVSAPTAQTFTHGGTGGTDNTLTLGTGEYITSVVAHWDKKDGHTRIFYLSFTTSAGNSISGGTQTDSTGSATAPDGYQLAGFYGRGGDEIDLLGAIWASIAGTMESPATVAPANISASADGKTASSASAAQATTVPTTTSASSAQESPTQAEIYASSGSATASSTGSVAITSSGSTAAVNSTTSSTGSATDDGTLTTPESPSTTAPTTSGPATQLSQTFGGPHGTEFSDLTLATSGQTITSITVRAGDRIDGLTLVVSAPTAQTFTHGGTGGTENTLTLGAGEYITSMEAHWGQKDGHTRIFYLSFGTSAGNSITGGTQTDESGSASAPDGYQLGGFFGRDGDEIDLLGVVWTSIVVVDDTATSSAAATVSDSDIVLSDLYGGPHGVAFSDIDSIKFAQRASSITVRSGERVDAVTLNVATPTEVTMNHGGSGGTENTLTLGAGEYITSMEAHWGKKDDHTRVFYLNFVTSAGNSISGGTQTDDKATATAPDGFQLGGFYGRAEDEVDQLGAIWTRMSAVDLVLTDEQESSGSSLMYGTTIRNWVGSTVGVASDTACYRKSVDYNSTNICPLGYGKDGDDCIAQCPMAYPVSCSLECIPQNDDCALETLSKIGSVVAVALNAASGGVFGEILAVYKTAKWAVTCVANIVTVIRGLIFYLRYRQTTAPEGDTAELLTVAYQTDVVVYDLPVAVCTCLGIQVPSGAKFADTVLKIVEGIVKQAITNGDEIISTGENVLNLLTGAGALNSTDSTVDELQDLIDTNSSCGYELKRLTDHVVRSVNEIRNTTPDALVDDIRVTVYQSSIVMNDIPAVTNYCMKELLGNKTITAAFETRDMLRKTFGVIIDELVETGTTDMGKDVAEDEYMLKVANMGLVVLSTIDPTGIAYMASQFVQPICGPTAYLGEIDDGRLYDALGLTTVDEAFTGSYGTWTKTGDGVVHLIFESVDTEDVTVVVHSGGDKYAEVDVAAGDTVTWDATVPELQDKNMYLDRWRPGLLGLPGSGGGSLLLWIPRSSEGGHLEMHVRINVS